MYCSVPEPTCIIPPDVEHIYGRLTEDQQVLVTELEFTKLKFLAADASAKYSVELEITGLTKDQRKNIHLVAKSFPQLGRRCSLVLRLDFSKKLLVML